MCANAVSSCLLVGDPLLGRLCERVPRMKIASEGNLSPKTKPPLFLRASRTSLTKSKASSRKKPPVQRTWDTKAHAGARKVVWETHPAKTHTQPRPSLPTAHLRHGPRHYRQPEHSLRPGHPRPTPWSTRGEKPDCSGIGHSGVEQSAEKRRGKHRRGGGETAPNPRPPLRGEQEE